MIKINLLPQEMIGGKGAVGGRASRGSGAAGIVLLLLLIFGIDAALAGWLFVTHNTAKKNYEQAKAEHEQVKKDLSALEVRFKDQQASHQRIEKLIQMVTSLDPPDRLLWSRKLNMLPLLVPEGIYMTEIRVNELIQEKETAASLEAHNRWVRAGRRGTPPRQEKVPAFTQTLHLNGVSYVADGTPPQRLDQIIRFQRNLMNERVTLPHDRNAELRFIEGFKSSVSPSAPVVAEKVSGRDVSKFSFSVTTNTQVIGG